MNSRAIRVCVIISLTATAGAWGQKLLPDDGAAFDSFGYSVAICGGTAIVGAPGDDDNGEASGSAYLFDITTGQQLAKLLADDGAADDVFASSVAISGDIAIIGAEGNDDYGESSGSAYLFDITTGQQLAKLLADDRDERDNFGYSVAISDDTAIVGAYGEGGNRNGAAYLFDIFTGQQLAKLLPDDGAARDIFGHSVAISGDTAIVGAPGDDDNGSNSGSVYLFDITTGQQFAKLLANDGAADDVFGSSVAISGDTAIIGAEGDDDYSESSGSAYLFDITTGQQLAKLLPDDGAELDRFGWSVDISGDTAIVGAEGDDDYGESSGSVYLFDITTGQQLAKLLPDDGAELDRFGWSVAISGDTAIVAAWGDDDNGERSGSAYLFDAGSCPVDIDADGIVDTRDFIAFLDLWVAGDPVTDWDGDGQINSHDFMVFLNDWNQGC